MTDDREPFREARAAGLKTRQERRLENATYTAAEVKVLTEAALRLGRKEALDEVCGCFIGPIHTLGDHRPVRSREPEGEALAELQRYYADMDDDTARKGGPA